MATATYVFAINHAAKTLEEDLEFPQAIVSKTTTSPTALTSASPMALTKPSLCFRMAFDTTT